MCKVYICWFTDDDIHYDIHPKQNVPCLYIRKVSSDLISCDHADSCHNNSYMDTWPLLSDMHKEVSIYHYPHRETINLVATIIICMGIIMQTSMHVYTHECRIMNSCQWTHDDQLTTLHGQIYCLIDVWADIALPVALFRYFLVLSSSRRGSIPCICMILPFTFRMNLVVSMQAEVVE